MKNPIKKILITIAVLLNVNALFCAQASVTKIDTENDGQTVSPDGIELGRQPRPKLKKAFTANKLDIDGYNLSKVQSIKELNEYTTTAVTTKAKALFDLKPENKKETINNLIKQFKDKSETKYVAKYSTLRNDPEFNQLDADGKRAAALLTFENLMEHIKGKIEDTYDSCGCCG